MCYPIGKWVPLAHGPTTRETLQDVMPRDAKYTLDGKFATGLRQDAEAPLIVQLYLEGNSFTRIAELLNRPVEYVSRSFHSDVGQAAYRTHLKQASEIRQELKDRAVFAAQAALDQIIALSQNASSEAVRRLAAKDVLDAAEIVPKTPTGGMKTLIIGDEAIARLCSVINELHAPTIAVDTLPTSDTPAHSVPSNAVEPDEVLPPCTAMA